jgi:hypothetical protein
MERDLEQGPVTGWQATLKWAAPSLPLLLSWPAIVLILLIYVALARGAPRRLEEILRPFDVVKIGTLELTKGSDTKRRVEGLFSETRTRVMLDYDLAVQQERLDRKLEAVVENHFKPFLKNAGHSIEEMRCTIHVADFLLADTVYQLLDYYPEGRGHGRTWSIRFGMIGKAWRSGINQIEGSVSTNREVLVREWGMTQREASARGADRSSFLAVLLRPAHEGMIGLFYADAKKAWAFTPAQNPGETDQAYGLRKAAFESALAKLIHEGCRKEGVQRSLLKIQRDLGGKAPLLKVYD